MASDFANQNRFCRALRVTTCRAILGFDGAPQYEAIARTRDLAFKVLVTGRHSRTLPKAHQLNSVNGLHAEWKRDYRTFFAGWR